MHISFSAIVLGSKMIIWHRAQTLASGFSSRVNAELWVKCSWSLASPVIHFHNGRTAGACLLSQHVCVPLCGSSVSPCAQRRRVRCPGLSHRAVSKGYQLYILRTNSATYFTQQHCINLSLLSLMTSLSILIVKVAYVDTLYKIFLLSAFWSASPQSQVEDCSSSTGFTTQETPHRSLGKFVGNPQGSTDWKTEQRAQLGKGVTRKIGIF